MLVENVFCEFNAGILGAGDYILTVTYPGDLNHKANSTTATVYISRYADDKYTFNTSYYYNKANFKEYTTGSSQVEAARHNAIGVFNENLDYKGVFVDYVLENCKTEEECENSLVTIYFTLAFLDTVDSKQMWRVNIFENYINYPED